MLLRASVLLVLANICLVAAEPFKYGYIASNANCRDHGKSSRVKFVSQSFAYCPIEVNRNKIVDDNKIFFNQVTKATCSDGVSITFEYVDVSDTSERSEQDLTKAMAETGYANHVAWHASADYSSLRCK